MKKLTKDDVAPIYKNNYWKASFNKYVIQLSVKMAACYNYLKNAKYCCVKP